MLLGHQSRIAVIPAIAHIIVCDVLVFDIAKGFVGVRGVFLGVFGDDVPGVKETWDVAEHAEEDVD